MEYQLIPYIWPLIFSSLASLSLGIYALLRRRKAKGSTSFILSMIAITIWSSANALEMSATSFSTKLFWANIQYFAYCYSPVTLLALCMEFTGFDQWIRNRKFLWLAVLPSIIIILTWTDVLHGLIRYDIHMDYSGSFPVLDKKYGAGFFIHSLYSQFLNISAWVLLIKAVFSKNTAYKKQALSLLSGVSLIILPNIMYILGLSPIKRFDITPIVFGPAVLMAAWGIFRFKLFEVVPIAWAKVIKTMDAGVMVLDLQDRVLDMNPAFERIVEYNSSLASLKPANEVCSKIPELVRSCLDKNNAHREFSINNNGLPRVYEVLFSPLTDDKGILIGWLAVTYDISKKKQEQQTYLQKQWEQAIKMEKERHARDLHDNLGQVLGFISFQAQGIKQELMNADIEIVSEKLDKLVDAAQAANSNIREYICNARNEKVIEKDFIAVLEQYTLNFEKQTGVKAKLVTPFEFTWKELNQNIRLNILNIIIEAFNNIRKHSEAKNAVVSFSLVQEQLCATVEDDGNGFDIDQYYNGTKTSFGLSIMRERAAEIGAQIDIKSTIGKGSRITLYVPVKEERKNADESNAGR